MGFKDQKLVSFVGRANREGGKREKKRRGRGRREEEEGGIKPRYGTLDYCMDSMRFGMNLWVCMMIILSLNLGF